MIRLREKDMEVRLLPDDVESAQVAGVRFAKSLAGAPSPAFMMALGEQEALVRRAVLQAGFGARNARLTARAFEEGAKLEWRRIAPAVQAEWGRA